MRLSTPADSSSATLRELIATANSDPLFLADPRVAIEPGQRMFERMKQVLIDSGAGLVYADAVGHPHLDYQLGSIRDAFDFGLRHCHLCGGRQGNRNRKLALGCTL